MIVTLTMNPALDITTEVDTVVATHKMRCRPPRYDPGGGGVNVARVARVLGARVSAIFPAGGVAGESLCRLLAESGVPIDRIPIAGATRESFTVKEVSSARQFRFVLPGPRLGQADQTECLDRLRHVAPLAGFVVASGSLPPGIPADFYQRVVDICDEVKVRLLLDSSGIGLQQLQGTAFLLKPSARELQDYTGRELDGRADHVTAARALIDAGRGRHVVVSLGGEGALLVTSRRAQWFPPLPVPPGSGVGAGDAMVAGIVVGLTRNWPMDKAVQLGNAAGAAMLLTPGTAACARADVDRLLATAAEPIELD